MSLHALEPGLLLAAPRLGDPNFEGMVVLLGTHDAGGSIGWTVNGAEVAGAAEVVRATGLVSAEERLPPLFEQPAFSGGPVSPESVWLLYRRAPGDEPLKGSVLIGPSIAVTSSLDALRLLLGGGGPRVVRILLGYAGWGASQLEDEVAGGAWLPAEADAGLLFDGPSATLWQRAYARTIGTIPVAFVGTTRGSA
jgi:putative transcriptional regulator